MRARGRQIAQIAVAFPGLFHYRDLLGMDVRELAFWEGEAVRQGAISKSDAARAARMGMADQESYMNIMSGYQSIIDAPNDAPSPADRARETWGEMKAKGKG